MAATTLVRAQPAEIVARIRPRPVSRWAVPLGGAVVGGLVFLLVYRSLVDDAYITLDFARNLGLHGQWGMVEGLTSNTATSPLNVILQGVATAVVRDAIVAAGLVLVALFAVAAVWLDAIGEELRLPRWRLPVLGVGFLATMPLLLSTVGLESYLAVTLIIGLARYALTRRWWLVGVAAGLLTLTRPDLLVFGLLAVLLAGRSWWRVAAAATGVALPWFAASWKWLGSAVPDSALLKVDSPWGGWSFSNGFGLWEPLFPIATALSIIPAVVGLACLPWWLRRIGRPIGVLWGGGALAHIALFCAMNTAPFHWYYAPSLSALGLIAVITCSALPGSLGKIGIGAAAVALTMAAFAMWNDGVPRDRAPIASNWASVAQYQAIAANLPSGATVRSPGEIGTLAYYCDCRVLDEFADRGYISLRLANRLQTAGPIERRVLELNFWNFRSRQPQPLDWKIDTPLVPVSSGTPPPMTGSWRDARQVIVTRFNP